MSSPAAASPVQGNTQSVLAITNLVRKHKELKQRKGIFQSRQVDFFRYKRFVRTLNSPDYKKHSENQPDLYPPIVNDDKVKEIFISLIRSQFVAPAVKLHSNELKDNDLRPNKDFPNLIMSKKATLDDDEYYVWNYNPKSIMDYFIIIGVIGAILALVLYPLWPVSMRIGSYYVSLSALAFLGVFFSVAIIRLILFLLSLAVVKSKDNKSKAAHGFWLFPNLFEDCGIFASFQPLYGFGNKECYSHIKEQKRIKRKQAKKAKKSAQTDSETKKIEEVKE